MSCNTRISLDHCVIHVSDWTRSNEFYGTILGAEVVELGTGFAYRFGDTQLNCHGPGQIGQPRAKLPVMPGGSDLCFEWPSAIESAARHLEQHGIVVELGPVERFGSRGAGLSIYFRDPDGSLLEFISYQTDS